jgi:predicted NBD/HSP70 family sugar kinase
MAHGPGSPHALREANEARILAVVEQAGGLTHAEIARRSGLSPASVSNLVRSLAASGKVQVSDVLLAGRRSRLVTQKALPGFVLGLDLGRTHVRAAIADRTRTVVGEASASMEAESTVSEGVRLAVDTFARARDLGGVDPEDVLAAAVGLPGPVDQVTGMIGTETLLPKWTGVDLAAVFRDALKVPTAIENDANLGALGEWAWPSPLAATTFVYIRLATGIGGGIIIDGKLHRGAVGTAGELGHMAMDENGPMCRCGNRGCLEIFASTPRQLALLSGAISTEVDVEAWIRMAMAGSPPAVRLVEDMGRHIGTAVANLANLINPAVVALGGPITAVGDLLLDPVRSEVRRRAMPSAARAAEITAARHEPRSEVFGALALALSAAAA